MGRFRISHLNVQLYNEMFIILHSHENIHSLDVSEKDDIVHSMLGQFVHIELDGYHSNAWHLHDGANEYVATIGSWNTS